MEHPISRARAMGAGGATKRLDTLLAALLVLLCAGTGPAQGPGAPFRIKSLSPAGVRSHLTDSWSVLTFTLANATGEDLQARVLTYYADNPGRQYGRDTWVPAKATLTSWFGIGPPSSPPARSVVELKSLLYDRSGGQEHLQRSS